MGRGGGGGGGGGEGACKCPVESCCAGQGGSEAAALLNSHIVPLHVLARLMCKHRQKESGS